MILTPENIWVIGITQQPTTHEYYLVFYHDTHSLLDKFIQHIKNVKHIQYSDFGEIKQIGVGGYGTAYTAEYKGREQHIPEMVVLKRFKSFVETPELFIS